MNVFHKFTRMSLRRNRSRTLVTIIGIMLSMAMFTAVVEAVYSGMQYLVRAETARVGAFHGYYYDMSAEDVEKLRQADGVSDVAVWQQVGWAEIEGKNEFKPYLLIESVDENFTDMVSVDLVKGRLPQNENEIAIPDNLRSSGGVSLNIGDTISLSVGERIIDGNKAGEFSYFDSSDREEIVNTQEKIYTVVGIFSRFDYLIETYDCPGFTSLTCGGGVGDYRAFFTVEHPSGFFAYMKDNALNDRWKSHSDLLAYSGSLRNGNLTRMLYGMVTILVALISFGSISLIYNSFSISVSERTRQFGILKSVGATRKQIRSTVIYEALLLCAVAIPLGMAAGCIGIGVTLWCLRDSFNFLLGSGESVQMYIVITPIGLAIAAAICLVTTLISAWIPAKRAIKISPIDAIRQTDDVKLKRRDVRTWGITKKLFGFEGMLASKNFGRNRKRYRATVISLFLSVTLFISASSFCAYLTDSVTGVSSSGGDSGYDIIYRMSSDDPDDADKVFNMLLGVDGVTKGTYFRHIYSGVVFGNELLSKDFAENSNIYGSKAGSDSCEINSCIIFAEDAEFRELCAANRLNADDFINASEPRALVAGSVVSWLNQKLVKTEVLKKSSIPASGYIVDVKAIEGYSCRGFDRDENGNITVYYYYPENYDVQMPDESLAIVMSPEDVEVRTPIIAGGVMEKLPSWQEESSFLLFVYPMSALDKVIPDEMHNNRISNTQFVFFTDNHAAVCEKMRQLLIDNGYTTSMLYDIAANYESSRTMVNVINVFSYGFIVLISLIAMANVFNTISTSISLRRREFAMLKSVGLTNRGFVRMMNFECLRYGIKGLALGLPAAFAVTYLIYLATSAAYEQSFYIPWYSVVIAVGSVFAVVFATMIYSTRKIKNDNPIDALKNENL